MEVRKMMMRIKQNILDNAKQIEEARKMIIGKVRQTNNVRVVTIPYKADLAVGTYVRIVPIRDETDDC